MSSGVKRWATRLGLSANSSMWIGLAALVSVGIVTWWWTRPVAAVHLPVYRTVPDFSLIDRSGKTITRADFLGRVSIVDFFYTRCTEACPLQSAYLARLQNDPTLDPSVLLVSITVDPDYDTPAVLASYASHFGADGRRWLFLTGPREAIYRLAVEGFDLAAFSARGSDRALAQTGLGPRAAWAPRGDCRSKDHSTGSRLTICRAGQGRADSRLRRWHGPDDSGWASECCPAGAP